MNIVFVRHQGDRRPYLFAVPEGVTLAKDTEVICDTCHGEATGKCFTQSLDVPRSAVEYFGPMLGAYFPLKSVVGEVRRQVVRFPTSVKEEKPDEKAEPVKLYCVKSYKPGIWCTEGKIYNLSAEGAVVMDDGWVEIYDDKCLGGRPFKSYLAPLVKRPAKIGEWVLVTDGAGHNYEEGRIYKVFRIMDGLHEPHIPDGSVYFADGGRGIVTPYQYLVLDGYKGDDE